MAHGNTPGFAVTPSLTPDEGWHCCHFYYRINRLVLRQVSSRDLATARQEIIQILDATGKSGAPLIINANDNGDGEHVQVYIG